jgi:hypothetical protein
MRIRFGSAAAFIALSLGMASCADNSVVGPEATRAGTMASLEGVGVRISEIHYDNTGTDAGEAIEISGPVGTSLVGYSIVL